MRTHGHGLGARDVIAVALPTPSPRQPIQSACLTLASDQDALPTQSCQSLVIHVIIVESFVVFVLIFRAPMMARGLALCDIIARGLTPTGNKVFLKPKP